MQHPSDLGMQTECDTGLGRGARGPSGETTFGTCQSELVFRDAHGAMMVIQAPGYSGDELPNERDIQQYKDILRGMGGLEPSKEALAAFAETPKKYLKRGRSLIYDVRGWLWAATQRDRDRWSYLDVYEGTALLGSVRVRDRLVGFDVLGSTLVTLVDRPAPPDMAADRGIDWYDFGRVIDRWGAPQARATAAASPPTPIPIPTQPVDQQPDLSLAEDLLGPEGRHPVVAVAVESRVSGVMDDGGQPFL